MAQIAKEERGETLAMREKAAPAVVVRLALAEKLAREAMRAQREKLAQRAMLAALERRGVQAKLGRLVRMEITISHGSTAPLMTPRGVVAGR